MLLWSRDHSAESVDEFVQGDSLFDCHHSLMSVSELKQTIGEVGEQKHEVGQPGLDEDPARQRRTRWLARSSSVAKSSFCGTIITSTSTKRARLGGLVGERRVQTTGLPASCWVGRPPVFGVVARKFLSWQPSVACTFVSPLRELARCKDAWCRPL